MHRHGHLACGVVSLYEGFHEFVLSHSPVVERGVIVRLQLVAHRPQHYARMAAVALDEFLHMVHPQVGEMCPSAAYILVVPLVVEFVHHEYSVLVAKVEERLRVRVVRRAYMVHAKFLHQFYSLLHGARVGGSSEGSEGVVVGIAFEQYFLAVEQQPLTSYQCHVAYSEAFGHLVAHCSVFAY